MRSAPGRAAGLGPAAVALAIAMGLGPAGCGEPDPTGDPELGRSLFETRPASSRYACADCHAMEPERPGELRRAGHPLDDAAGRPSYFNGAVASLPAAIDVCVQAWLALDAEDAQAWSLASGHKLRDVASYLASTAPATAPALAFEIVEPGADPLSGGDAGRGAEVYASACEHCHGYGLQGTQLGPKFDPGLDGPFIAIKTRRSGPTTLGALPGLSGGVMPFWSLERLSSSEMADLLAYFQSL